MVLNKNDFADFISKAWQGDLEFFDLLKYTERLESEKLAHLAIILYQTWINRSSTPYNHMACFNLAVLQFNQGYIFDSKDSYLKAIQLSPSFVQPHFNLGLTYEKLGDIHSAINELRWIEDNIQLDKIEYRSFLLLALNNLARIYEDNKNYSSALAYLAKSLDIEPNQTDVIHHWIFLREKVCAWPVMANVLGLTPELMMKATSALAMLSLSDEPERQLSVAQSYVESKVNSNVIKLAPNIGYKHRKIRVAYCSSDFCIHPVAMLTVELLELHNRDGFEIYGYCWTNQGNSAIRQRVIDAVDHFQSIINLSDEEAATLIRSHEIDILIDLHGQTLGARPNLLAFHPAPIQITYLGLPATTGLPSIDYVIADRFLIPEEYSQFYSEKPLYMPDVYQVSDRQRVSAAPLNKSDYNLPEQGFIFCSFNNNYKYTPEVFDCWMAILDRVPDSVLWLLADNPWAMMHLKQEAKQRGIKETRLIFANRVSTEQYLARYAVADLFLDTFPFNAGTTANDALWMGLPVLTLCGRSFASRMAGALLNAAELPELITYDLKSYENKAVEIASNPNQLNKIKVHLHEIRDHGVLFDTPRFVKNLELHFKTLISQLQIAIL